MPLKNRCVSVVARLRAQFASHPADRVKRHRTFPPRRPVVAQRACRRGRYTPPCRKYLTKLLERRRVLRCRTIPAAYSKTPGAIRRLPPPLGEHGAGAGILREACFGADETDALFAFRSGARRTLTQAQAAQAQDAP